MLSRHLAVAAALAAVILVVSQLGLYRNSIEKERATRWATHTYESIHELESISSGLALAESSLRGYAIKRDARFLPGFSEGVAGAQEGLARSLQLTIDNAQQQQRLRALQPRLAERLAQLSDALELAKQGRSGDEVTPSDRVVLTGELRHAIEGLVHHERRLLEQRLHEGLEKTEQAQTIALLGALVALVLSGLVFRIVWRHTTRLRDAEEELRLTVDNAPIGMALVAANGTSQRVNDALCDIVGNPREKLLGALSQQLIHPDDRERAVTEARRMLAGEITSQTGELRFVRDDGGAVWVNAAMSLVRAAPGRAPFFIVQLQDVSARRTAEAEARIFFAQSVDLLAINTSPVKLDKINEAWERTLGWSQHELLSQPLTTFVHPDDHDKTLREAEAIEHGQPSRAFRNRYRAKDGRYHWLDWRMHRTGEGRLFCLPRDVTEET